MALQHTTGTPRPVVFILATSFLGLLGLMLLTALLTRPVERHKLPSRLSELLPALAALHQHDSRCSRWVEDVPLTPAEVDAVRADITQVMVADLRTVLPLLSLIRSSNVERSKTHHTHPPEEEFKLVSMDRLNALDTLRLRMRYDRMDELLPGLERFEALERRRSRDAQRSRYLTARLNADELKQLDALVERWRFRLAGDAAQASLIHEIASDVTWHRLSLLQQLIERYHQDHRRFPVDLPSSLSHHIRTGDTLPDAIQRGIGWDGTLRDGWLRPFTYYTVGKDNYRLSSAGASSSNDVDNITLQSTQTPR